MSIRKPVIRKPKVPKIKKPLISKRKRIVKQKPTLSAGRIATKTQKKPLHGTKTRILGTCYLEKNCKCVLSRKVTKIQCRHDGGKSWRKIGGACEKL